MLPNVTFVGHAQQVIHQTRIKINHTCKVIKACNLINSHQHNKPVENWYRVKNSQINNFLYKGTIKIVTKGLHDLVIPFVSNKHTINIAFTTDLFPSKYIPNNITVVFLTGIYFLYNINVVHNESILLPNGSWNKMNKK